MALLFSLTACSSGDPDPTPEPSTDSSADPAECVQDPTVLTLAEEGWSVTRTDGDENWINFAAVFDSQADVLVDSAEVTVEWLDAQGEVLGWGPTDTSGLTEPVPVDLSGDGGALSGWAIVEGEPAEARYTVVQACGSPQGESPGTVTAADPVLEVTDGRAELGLTVDSGLAQSTAADLVVVFRNRDGEIIGGTLGSDGDVFLAEVAPGQAQYEVSFAWEQFYPDDGDVAEVEVRVTPMD